MYVEPIQKDWAEVERQIGLICRSLVCCCPPGAGHNHPLYDQYLAHLDRSAVGDYVDRERRRRQ